jgi:hypothetical protein
MRESTNNAEPLLPGAAKRAPAPVSAVLLFAVAFVCLSARAQDAGPMKLPSPAPGASPTAKPALAAQSESPRISTAPPSVPVEQIIERFAARELEFKRERENFTYQQTFVIQTIDRDGQVDGEYKLSSDILFTPEGKRYETVTDAPQPTLTRISLSQQDLDDLEHVQPFVLTTEELPKYDVNYVGRERLDEIETYVFDVAPKKIEKNKRYFQGRIWVDQKDLEIVKTYGKAVPDIRTKNGENVFPRFETFRENIEGNYWFPTYTHANDVLRFTIGDVRIRMIVRYKNYKRYGVSIKIGTPTAVKPDHR